MTLAVATTPVSRSPGLSKPTNWMKTPRRLLVASLKRRNRAGQSSLTG